MQEKNNTPVKDFMDRLELALHKAGMNRSGLARAVGVSGSTVSRWNGKHLPTPVLMNLICDALGVRREWLSAGLEPMEPDPIPGRMMEDSPIYRVKVSADNQMMSAMVTIINEVMAGIRPKDELEQVHALLDLVHPMPQKED